MLTNSLISVLSIDVLFFLLLLNFRSAMINSMISDLSTLSGYKTMNHADPLLPNVKSRQYKPLLSRPKCESLQDRIAFYEKKGKVMKRRADPRPQEPVTSGAQVTSQDLT